MVTRIAILLAAALAFTGCATVELDRDDATAVVERAFADAGVDAASVEVAEQKVDGRWAADLTVDGTPVSVEVDAGRGSVVALDLGRSAMLDRAQLEAIARYAENPADEAAQRRRWATLFVVLLAFLAVGYALARRVRLREEATAPADNTG